MFDYIVNDDGYFCYGIFLPFPCSVRVKLRTKKKIIQGFQICDDDDDDDSNM